MCDGSGSGTSTSCSAESGPVSSVIWIALTRADPNRTPPPAPGSPAAALAGHPAPAIPSSAAAKRDSSTGWTTITSRACSPRPFWTTDLTDTSCWASTCGDLRQHARLVGHLEVEVEGGDDVLDDLQRPDRRRRRRRRDHRADHVAEHRGRGLRAAGAGPGHRDLGDRLGLDRDRVERPVDRGQRMARVQERRVDADRQAVADPLGGADQLQPEAEVAGVLEVVGLDLLDPLVADLVEVHRRVERQPGEDRHLGRGVAAVDVLGGVGLGVAEPLGLGQRVVERHPGARHLGEDEVGGAVDDPVDAVDRGPRQRLLEHADHRDDARPRRPRSAAARPRCAATSHSSSPCWESSCLLAVTTCSCRPAAPAARSRARARSRRSARRSGPSARAARRTTHGCGSGPRRARAQARDHLDPLGVLRAGARRTPQPTVPWPSSPTRKAALSRHRGRARSS